MTTNGIQKNIADYKDLKVLISNAIPALLGWVINFPLRELAASVPAEFAVVESSLLDVLLPRTRCSTPLLKLSN